MEFKPDCPGMDTRQGEPSARSRKLTLHHEDSPRLPRRERLRLAEGDPAGMYTFRCVFSWLHNWCFATYCNETETDKGVESGLQIKSVSKHAENEVAYIEDGLGLHQMSNPSNTEPAVSLHLYTVSYLHIVQNMKSLIVRVATIYCQPWLSYI